MGVSLGLLSSYASADALKNSLTNIMKTDDAVPMVDLSNINLNAKVKPIKRLIKHRSSKSVVGIVNTHKIIKKDADAYLTQRTNGKIKNYDSLPDEQKIMLLKELSLPYLAYDMALKELHDFEKVSIFNRTWIQKEARNVEIKDNDIRLVYNQLKQKEVDNNSTNKLPEFIVIKERLRMQMIEKQIMTKLMKDVQIKVVD